MLQRSADIERLAGHRLVGLDGGEMRVHRAALRLPPAPPRLAVAIPARNEEALLPACLRALAAALDRLAETAVVVILVNGSDDATFDEARRHLGARGHGFAIVDGELAPGANHAGGARRLALDLGAALLPPGGALLTTDADSAVDRGWATACMRGLRAGNHIVCGRVRTAAHERAAWPPWLRERGRLEARIKAAAVALEDLLDPIDHNPPPRHGDVFGASLAIDRDAYLAVGGMPRVSSGEDFAMVERMIDHDRRVFFARDAIVLTSLRSIGRATGGVADAIAMRLRDPHASCDASILPAPVLARRLLFRRRLRALWTAGVSDRRLAAFAGVCDMRATHARHFGALHRQLARNREPAAAAVPASALGRELARYDALLAQARAAGANP